MPNTQANSPLSPAGSQHGEQTSILGVQIAGAAYSGPIPPPALLREFNEVIPATCTT